MWHTRKRPRSGDATPRSAGVAAPSSVHEVLREPGRPLDVATRTTMEARFGHDFGSVRVHAGPTAAASTAALGAVAYAVGRHVVFDPPRYSPETEDGARLLAHELTHVVQQDLGRAAGVGAPARSSVASHDDEAEREATALGGQPPHAAAPVRPAVATGPAVQRQGRPGSLRLRPPPLVARGMGSLNVDGFVTDSAALPPGAAARLGELAARIVSLLEDYPGGSVTVVGHTDAVGAEAHNEQLGQTRADAVRDVLVGAGVPAGIVMTSSRGEGSPAVLARGADARNRRVSVSFEPESRFTFGMGLTPPEPLTPLREGAVPPPLFPPRIQPSDIFRPETPEETGRRIFRPLPPVPAGTGPRSLNDAVRDAIDRAIDPLISPLPPWARSMVRDAAHAGAARGARAVLDQALDAAGVQGPEREAIRSAVEAASRTPLR